MQAGLIAEVLRRVWSKWGPISESDLTAYLGQRTHVPEPLAAHPRPGLHPSLHG